MASSRAPTGISLGQGKYKTDLNFAGPRSYSWVQWIRELEAYVLSCFTKHTQLGYTRQS